MLVKRMNAFIRATSRRSNELRGATIMPPPNMLDKYCLVLLRSQRSFYKKRGIASNKRRIRRERMTPLGVACHKCRKLREQPFTERGQRHHHGVAVDPRAQPAGAGANSRNALNPHRRVTPTLSP